MTHHVDPKVSKDVPISALADVSSVLRLKASFNDSEESCSTQELIAWDATITAEDRDILEATDADADADADACVDTTRRVEFHMPSDQPGLVIRKQLLSLLHAHGEQEVHRGSPAMQRAAPIP